jgi:hypothetical protein
VATPALPPGGIQQWMCDAVVPASKPLNSTLTAKVWAVVSNTTVACPVPGDPVDGDSFAPVRSATNVVVAARAADMGRTTIPATANINDIEAYVHLRASFDPFNCVEGNY